MYIKKNYLKLVWFYETLTLHDLKKQFLKKNIKYYQETFLIKKFWIDYLL